MGPSLFLQAFLLAFRDLPVLLEAWELLGPILWPYSGEGPILRGTFQAYSSGHRSEEPVASSSSQMAAEHVCNIYIIPLLPLILLLLLLLLPLLLLLQVVLLLIITKPPIRRAP